MQLHHLDNQKWQKEVENLNQQKERFKQQIDLQDRQLKQFQLSLMTRIRQQREEALEYYRKQGGDKYSSKEDRANNNVCDCGSTEEEDTSEQDAID